MGKSDCYILTWFLWKYKLNWGVGSFQESPTPSQMLCGSPVSIGSLNYMEAGEDLFPHPSPPPVVLASYYSAGRRPLYFGCDAYQGLTIYFQLQVVTSVPLCLLTGVTHLHWDVSHSLWWAGFCTLLHPQKQDHPELTYKTLASELSSGIQNLCS